MLELGDERCHRIKCYILQQRGVGKGNILLKQLFQGAYFLKIIHENMPACALMKTIASPEN